MVFVLKINYWFCKQSIMHTVYLHIPLTVFHRNSTWFLFGVTDETKIHIDTFKHIYSGNLTSKGVCTLELKIFLCFIISSIENWGTNFKFSLVCKSIQWLLIENLVAILLLSKSSVRVWAAGPPRNCQFDVTENAGSRNSAVKPWRQCENKWWEFCC